MPAKPRPLAASTPADWKAIEQAATAELAKRTQLAHQQIVGLLSTHGHLLSDAQRRALGKRLQRSGK
ncbi:hypothetical protein FHY18_000786 [Xanthomonas arboricola]|uniref:hypothetical protein n=1 Tax=Xanthomonas sp. 3793 TaxID=3035312 RepID=UPI002166C50E|nr:hypothetical protein [Xanthomonas sp. 3793]MCS3745256.1 hypothetical protein [Xanthomonas sp. 3793]